MKLEATNCVAHENSNRKRCEARLSFTAETPGTFQS